MFVVWLALGLPYMAAALRRFPERRLWFTDIGLHLLLLGQGIVAALDPRVPKGSKKRRRSLHIWKNRRITNTLRSMGVKFFFTPLMVSFLSGHLNSVSNAWLRRKALEPLLFPATATVQEWWAAVSQKLPALLPNGSDLASLLSPHRWSALDVRWGLDVAYDLVFITDCGVAVLGYMTESRFLGNKTRSAEPTGFGWLVAVTCYPPFNNVLGTYLPINGGSAIIRSETWLLVLKAGIVLLFAIYASATVSFGLKFSNLTNRGIITRGPYRFIRHPAYVCKCIAWWLERLPNLTPESAFFLACTCGWYGLRAWTEERHLSQDPDYVAYKKKVPWKAIPGVW